MENKISNAKQYRKRFSGPKNPQTGSNLESSSYQVRSEFSESDVAIRLGKSKENLHKLIEKYLNNDPELKKLADEVIKSSAEALKAVAGENDDYLDKHPSETRLLEVIVRTDGSRPSFMIRNGKIDFETSPVEGWKGHIIAAQDELKNAIESTGRINIGEKQRGTGFMIQRNLIITNRHVLQLIGRPDKGGNWTLNKNANIDFGHEFDARKTLNRRKLKKVIFTSPDFIDPYTSDHAKLDLALIELEDAKDENVPLHILQMNNSKTWAKTETLIFTIGYSGDPGDEGKKDYTESVLDKLFKSTYGCKRLAPGEIMERDSGDLAGTLKHDASTLGGNSGSVIVPVTGSGYASGLHYGGDFREPRENWGHVLGSTFSVKNQDNHSLDEYFSKFKFPKIEFVEFNA